MLTLIIAAIALVIGVVSGIMYACWRLVKGLKF